MSTNNIYKIFYSDDKKHKDKQILKKHTLSLVNEMIEKTQYFYDNFVCNTILNIDSKIFSLYLKVNSPDCDNIKLTSEEHSKLDDLNEEDKYIFNFIIDNLNIKYDNTKNSIYSYPFNSDGKIWIFLSNEKDTNGSNYYLSYDARDDSFKTHFENNYSYLNHSISSSFPTKYMIKLLNSWQKELLHIQHEHWLIKNENLNKFQLSLALKYNGNNKDLFIYRNNKIKEFLSLNNNINKDYESKCLKIINKESLQELMELTQLSKDHMFNFPFKIDIDNAIIKKIHLTNKQVFK